MYKQIDSNIRLTWGLMTLFLIFVIAVGWVFSRVYNEPIFLVVAVLVAVIQSLVSYYYSDKIALFTTGAREAKTQDFLDLYRVVENLSIASGLPQPKIYVISDPAPNAFATGRDPKNASLAVTTGLLERLNKTELEGVISHEMSHIGNRDILVMTVVVVLVGTIALLADWFLRMRFWGFRDNDREGGGAYLVLIGLILSILAPISATLIQLAISRRREYLADATGALMTRYPEGLASALEKIGSDKIEMRLKNRATAHLFIADPYKSDKKFQKSESWLAVAFSTHPPIAERIRRLRGMIS